MAHWLDDPLTLRTYSEEAATRDPDGRTKDRYKKVWCELGGPHQLEGFRRIPDDRPFFNLCLRYPYEEWLEWCLDQDNDEHLRWWPQLAALAGFLVHARVCHQRHADLSFSGISAVVSRIATSLAAVERDLDLLRQLTYLQRPLIEEDQNKGALIRDVLFELDHATLRDGEDADDHWSSASSGIRKFRRGADQEVKRLNDLQPQSFRTGRERVPGLNNLVARGGKIWIGMNCTRPSAEKVTRKDGESDPPFVRFIQSVCILTGSYEPTRAQVATAVARVKRLGFW